MIVGRGTKPSTALATPARMVLEEMFRLVGMRYVSSSVVKPVIVGILEKEWWARSLVGKSATKVPSTTGSHGAVPVGRGENLRATRAMTLKREGAGVVWTQENIRDKLVVVLQLGFWVVALVLAMIYSLFFLEWL
jgi:hypothetical protein